MGLPEELSWLPALVLIFVCCIWLVWATMRQRADHSRQNDALVRIETRVDAQNKLAELRARAGDELLRALATTMRGSQAELRQALEHRLGEGRAQTVESLAELRGELRVALVEQQKQVERRQAEMLKVLEEALQRGTQSTQQQISEALSRNASELGRRVEGLTQTTDQRLKDISGQVEKRLSEGFEKTTATFADVIKRLALIDEAQKKLTELSRNVVSLQEILADKRSRGAFGEVQLNALIRNVMPESSFALQYTLGNERVADCVLFLPAPTGTVAIDAKFPLEAYQTMTKNALGDVEKKRAERQFKHDIRKHIRDIATRYIVHGETSNGAVMFIPAEAVFAEIQGRHADLVQEAQRARVWMVSPTTLMAILNTARAVLKDEATQRQVHIIQEHLAGLSRDFDRFKKRMDNLSRHIKLANKDVDDVHVSAQKITSRFEKIERVEVEHEGPAEPRAPATAAAITESK